MLGAITSTEANIFSHMSKSSVFDKLVNLNEHFTLGELKTSGLSSVQVAVDSLYFFFYNFEIMLSSNYF